MPTPRQLTNVFTLGGRVPAAVGQLMAATVLLSAMAAFLGRHGLPLFEMGALSPPRVLRGELWRLATWVILQPSPLGLLIGCLLLFWFGRDLASVWGGARFVTVYLGVAVLAGVGTTLVAVVDPDVADQTFLGGSPLAEAMVVAWGLLYPHRTILLYFILPISGRLLVYLTVGGTIVFALYLGWEGFLPSLLAEGLMAAYVYRRRLTTWFASLRDRGEQASRRRRVASVTHLRPVPRNGGDEPPKDRPPN